MSGNYVRRRASPDGRRMTDQIAVLGSVTAEEIASQPAIWGRAMHLEDTVLARMPTVGARVLTLGCIRRWIADAPVRSGVGHRSVRGDRGMVHLPGAYLREPTGEVRRASAG